MYRDGDQHPALTEHLAELARTRYSTATTTSRRRVLQSLADANDGCLFGLDRTDVQRWWAARELRPDGTPRAASSMAQDSSHVRAFYRWAIVNGLDTMNVADWLARTRQVSRKANPVGEADLLVALEKSGSPMRQMVALAAMAGFRAAEIAGVRWEDIDRTAGIIWVRDGKGGKDRSVPLSAGLLGQLGEPSTGLIVGHPMRPNAVSMAIARFLRGCGVDSTAHKLRARYATRFLAATGDLVATAEAMGHSSVATTALYAVASSDTMRRGAEAAGRVG